MSSIFTMELQCKKQNLFSQVILKSFMGLEWYVLKSSSV